MILLSLTTDWFFFLPYFFLIQLHTFLNEQIHFLCPFNLIFWIIWCHIIMNYFRIQIDPIFVFLRLLHRCTPFTLPSRLFGRKRKTLVTELILIGFASRRVCQEHLLWRQVIESVFLFRIENFCPNILWLNCNCNLFGEIETSTGIKYWHRAHSQFFFLKPIGHLCWTLGSSTNVKGKGSSQRQEFCPTSSNKVKVVSTLFTYWLWSSQIFISKFFVLSLANKLQNDKV